MDLFPQNSDCEKEDSEIDNELWKNLESFKILSTRDRTEGEKKSISSSDQKQNEKLEPPNDCLFTPIDSTILLDSDEKPRAVTSTTIPPVASFPTIAMRQSEQDENDSSISHRPQTTPAKKLPFITTSTVTYRDAESILSPTQTESSFQPVTSSKKRSQMLGSTSPRITQSLSLQRERQSSHLGSVITTERHPIRNSTTSLPLRNTSEGSSFSISHADSRRPATVGSAIDQLQRSPTIPTRESNASQEDNQDRMFFRRHAPDEISERRGMKSVPSKDDSYPLPH